MLTVNSYLQHEWFAGLYILLTHDITDVFLAGSRVIEAFYKPKGVSFKSIITYFYFAFTVLAWIYFRNYAFFCIPIYVSWKNFGNWGIVWPMISAGYYYSFFLTLVLFTMDIFWSLILIKIVAAGIIKQNYTNNYDPNVTKLKKWGAKQ